MNKKIIIEAKPSAPMFPNEIAHGNKNAISRSKIIKLQLNKILHQIPFLSPEKAQIHIHKQIVFLDLDA